jgi:uncharacterized protein
MRRELRRDLTAVLKNGDRVAVAAIRSALAAIDNAEAVEVNAEAIPQASSEHIAGATAGAGSSDVQRRELTDADVAAIVRRQVDERAEAADEYDRLGRHDHAERLRREAAVLAHYLSTEERWS